MPRDDLATLARLAHQDWRQDAACRDAWRSGVEFVDPSPAEVDGIIRGHRAGDVVRYCDDNRARWSESARGWVVPREIAVNAAAWAEYAGLLVVVTKAREAS